MVELELVNPHWLEDAAYDQCAHGGVHFAANGTSFVSPEETWTVSAAALFLLRTIRNDHVGNQTVCDGNFLFPCCGFTLIHVPESRYPTFIFGCPRGIDVSVRHNRGLVALARDDLSAVVQRKDWTRAVLEFAKAVKNFYAQSPPRDPITDPEDEAGWQSFWREWDELVSLANPVNAD